MTLRAKPVVKRRSPGDSSERRNFLTNLAFGLVIAAAILILVAAAAISWYNDHLATVGSVDGTNITVDHVRERAKIEGFRVDYAASRVNTELAAGRISQTVAAQQLQQIEQRRQQIGLISLERLIDILVIDELAAQEGVSVSPADVDARLLEEKTIPPSRHAWIIEVAPAIDPGETEPTPEQIAEARAKVMTALGDLRAGKPWEDVARAVSTAASAPQAGDLGWLVEDATGRDASIVDAIFAVEANTPSDVIETEAGTFVIVRVTEIDPGSVDGTFEARIEDAGVTIEEYREAIRFDVLRQKLEDKVVAQALEPGPQRRVAEILLPSSGTPPAEGAVKTRHILYAPNDDPSGAAAGDIPDDDPAWETARAEAQATYDRLVADLSLFDSIARAESDETSAKQTGGKLPWFDGASAVDPDFLKAVTAEGLEPGDLIRPFKSAFGYHVVQLMRRPPDIDWARRLKEQLDAGADFAALARDHSEGNDPAGGGIVGWIAKGEFDKLSEAAIFAAPVGGVTEPVEVAGIGVLLYKVLAEEVRPPTPEQEATIRATAFSAWYAEKKATFTIIRDQNVLTSVG